jgi:dienelactone hydrolase
MIAALVLAAMVAAASPTPSPERRFVDRPVRENALVGEFSAPADGGRHPALIVLGGFEGDVVPGEAYGLALQGYSAFAVAYFGKSPLPNAADKVPVETVSRAIDWLRAQPEVDPAHIGIVGISQGSALALLAAGRDPRIRAVAVISPSAYVWFAPAFDNAPDRSSWSENNGPLPFIGPDRHAEDKLGEVYRSGGTYAFRDLYDASLAAASRAAVASATIPVERIGVPVLCVAGDDDRQWDSAGACKTIAARRRGSAGAASDEVVIEPGAGHASTLGGRPTADVISAGKMSIRLGGSTPANSRAAADTWARTLTFFGRTL